MLKFELRDGEIWANPDRDDEIPKWDAKKNLAEAWEAVRAIEDLIDSTEEV